MHGLQSSYEDFRKAGAEVLTISVDDVEHNAKVVKSLSLEFPILSDAENEVIRDWGVVDKEGGIGGVDIARPATFILDAEGIIRWRALASNWRVRSSPEEIIEAIHRMDRMGPFGAGGEQRQH
ncbi:MAG: hypothetical protein DRJ65_14510 [Acidobacteria bacterium]|nr:MAG: hypothetical protein DRJ65_14510 [Acidobacteriota bacterium]